MTGLPSSPSRRRCAIAAASSHPATAGRAPAPTRARLARPCPDPAGGDVPAGSGRRLGGFRLNFPTDLVVTWSGR
ncbi:hypothetical protein [Nonomuraea cavernae]|uniref:hypothetical protein n=1 Tax=Nonomuraea cavernae TaxID=2045107 RepID=UPI0033D6DB7B